ncbi:MAG: tRNA guanosine(15) transglycosylase TgtA [Thermoplasmatota archaeon]
MTDDEGAISTFEVKASDLAGRSAVYTVKGRKIVTPELMPVVNPNRMNTGAGVPPSELADRFGFGSIITNSYIIKRSERLRAEALEKGLHDLLGFEGAIMTDSGTFQSYMYGGNGGEEVDVDPLEIVGFQNAIGSDIGTILDRFTVPDSEHGSAEKDLEITLERARASMVVNSGMELAVPVQGGRHPDLREMSGRGVFELGVGYAPIGGVVPIMESYDYSLLVDVIVASKKGLGPSVPTHLFGAGHPMLLPLAVALGCDLFDSASYAKFAQADRYMTRYRTLHLGEMTNLPCSCPVCASRGPEDLLEMDKEQREGLLSRHNLWVLRDVLQEVRAAIAEGTLWELVERSALANPSMYSAVRRLLIHTDHLEENAPRTTRRFMSSTGLSIARPEFARMRIALNGLEPPVKKKKALALTDWTISHSFQVRKAMWESHPEEAEPVIITPFGAVPFDLDDMYPVSQSVFPPPGSIDREMQEYMNGQLEGHLERFRSVVRWDGRGEVPLKGGQNELLLLNLRRVRPILRMQFGKLGDLWSDEIILPEPDSVRIVTSRKTGKIRNILEVGDHGTERHLLSLRAEDGHLNLRWTAAERLHASSDAPSLRVMVEEGTGEYNARGFNVFCKFVRKADRQIRAGDDVLVVDEKDQLFAVGRAAVGSRMMTESKIGTAVKVRDGAEKH